MRGSVAELPAGWQSTHFSPARSCTSVRGGEIRPARRRQVEVLVSPRFILQITNPINSALHDVDALVKSHQSRQEVSHLRQPLNVRLELRLQLLGHSAQNLYRSL